MDNSLLRNAAGCFYFLNLSVNVAAINTYGFYP